MEGEVQIRLNPDDGAPLKNKPSDLSLEDSQPGLQLTKMLHPELVGFLVALGPGGLDGRALGRVQQPKLDAGHVGGHAHLSPQGIDLADDVALGLAPDGGVTAHLGDGVDVPRQEQNIDPHAGGGQGGFHAGMASPADDDVVGAVGPEADLFVRSHRRSLTGGNHLPMQKEAKSLSSIRSLSMRPTISPRASRATRPWAAASSV